MSESLVFLYPGQGAQEIGMGVELYDDFPEARKRFAQADRFLGYSLTKICFEGPPAVLNQDAQAQLAVYTLSCILTDFLMAHQVFPCAASGYSSGFYAAGYAAGCYTFEQGLAIVRRAGEILLSGGRENQGGMANIFGLPQAKVQAICERIGQLEIAIFNTTSQFIVSGPLPALARAVEAAKAEGALDAYLIRAAAPYHSRPLESCSRKLFSALKDQALQAPTVPLYSYFDLEPVRDEQELKEIMAVQISRPVFWVDLIHKFNSHVLIEVGPGMLLSRTIRWINRQAEVLNTSERQNIHQVLTRFGNKEGEGERYETYAESMLA